MQVLSVIMGALVCITLTAVICMQVTKIYWAWKSKGESLRPRGAEDNIEKGGKED